MDSNNLISATQIDDVSAIFQKWEKSLSGSKEDREGFFRFMTTPSMDRSRFIVELKPERSFYENVMMSTIKKTEDES